MPKLFDRVKVNIPTTGTGTITFGAASSNAFLTPTEAGCADGDTVRYVIVDGTDYEEGIGTIGASVTTMSRAVTKSKIGGTAGTTALTLSGTAVLALVASAADIVNAADNLSDLASATTALTNLGGTTTGKALFTAVNAADARDTIGATTVGEALITATDAAAARDAIGDYDVAHGGTGTTNLTGFISGLQPLKIGGAIIGVNPGAWANNTGTAVFSSTDVMRVDLQAAVPDFTQTPALGAQVSGALTATANSTDGTEVFLYLVHRNSDGKPALIGSSSDTQGPNNRTFTATAASPGVFTFATAHGFRKRMPIYFSNSGGALPAPLTTNTQYYICTVPSDTTFTIATSIANVNSGIAVTTTTTGSGTNTATWGVQADLDFQLGSGVATFDRRLPYFAFVWSWTKYGNAGVPGGSNGIPDFQVAQGATDTLITNAGQAPAFQALLQGTATSFTAIDLSPWLANINRRVMIFTYCDFPSTAGGAFMRTTGSGGPGIQVGAPSTATIGVTGLYSFQTDSTSKIDYKVTGGARLSVYVMGWTQVDPS